ncbi:MAG: plasmid recombination protein, partial [Acidaminococcaceae bacterium]|nr:plasmid recombination protein [Acidaminococcaceae bacterium]
MFPSFDPRVLCRILSLGLIGQIKKTGPQNRIRVIFDPLVQSLFTDHAGYRSTFHRRSPPFTLNDEKHHFKTPSAGYREIFAQMEADGVISTRGIKEDAFRYSELVFDVNSAYFYNHGGYDFAKQFYTEAYKAAIKIVGGEQYILSAVMHADERNRAMSEALGEDVYHYHLHVVYIPVVEKEIRWTKRCKDKSLVGKVKETIMQVSMSKKWASKSILDEATGEPLCTAKGKPVLRKSYSVLQDDFFEHMRSAGYDNVERGERGSSEEHLTVMQFKTEREQERLA